MSENVSDNIAIEWVIDNGWIHTHGLSELGYPELEVRDAPSYLAEPAADLLRQIFEYMIDSKTRIKPGETMATSPRTRFRLVQAVPIEGDEDHYLVERLTVAEHGAVCECCGASACQA